LSTNNSQIASEFKRIFDEEPQQVKKWLKWADIALKNLGYEIPVGHKSATDIVNDVIIKTIDDVRKWNPEKVPLNVYMYHNIRSEVSNAKCKEKKRRYITIGDDPDENYSEDDELQNTQINPNNNDNESITDFVIELENKDLIELISKEIDKDYECSILLEAMKEVDLNKNKELAETTGYSVEMVENIKKKFFRRTNKIAAKYRAKN